MKNVFNCRAKEAVEMGKVLFMVRNGIWTSGLMFLFVLFSACVSDRDFIKARLNDSPVCSSEEDCADLKFRMNRALSECYKQQRMYPQSLKGDCDELDSFSERLNASMHKNAEPNTSRVAREDRVERPAPKKQEPKKPAPVAEDTSSWENVQTMDMAKACDDYMEFREYANYLMNRRAARGMSVDRAHFYCIIVYYMATVKDFDAWVMSDIDGIASSNEIARRQIRDAIRRNTNSAPLIVAEVRKVLENHPATCLLPPGTTEELRKVQEVLPEFRQRAAEQDKTTKFRDDVNAAQKACMRKCVLGAGGSFEACERVCGPQL